MSFVANCESHQNHNNSNETQGFLFETDFPELKANPDYKKLIETMIELIQLRAVTVQVPEIDFSHYKFPKTDSNGDEIAVQQFISKYLFKENEQSQTEDKKGSKLVVRGREYNNSKPQTFNQLWTAEEQLRLEELLLKYPPERKESQRWVKIAAALGNRTPKQVCSRVQKYFLKLRKMGFSVPGRNPRSSHQKNKPRAMKKNFVDKNTTFFPKIKDSQSGTIIPITDEDRFDETLCDTIENSECYTTSEMESADWLTDSKRLEILLRIKSDKEKKSQVIQHFNITCWNCGVNPIVDMRWTCFECASVHFCSDCVAAMVSNNFRLSRHPVSHQLDPVASFDSVRDPDYLPHNFNSASYLDPNFILH
ncbi:ZZ-type zinc finger-containing protein 3 isoform X2 [Nilaparvata lugens]|uniref:ZZ-type zinc finger-containing protein 3 isoform X2 n=1 Tax=Nilaparvata lugens TaxID=108931 RepID=UPI00193D1665|nr:ZZ-type zinc finger-containing protein 3 isoform X2 [Nilaparvata lugens]